MIFLNFQRGFYIQINLAKNDDQYYYRNDVKDNQPSHGNIGKLLTYTVLVLSLWGSCISVFGNIASPPNGTIFWLIVLVIFAMIFGWVFSLARLPPLLGMLVTGKRYMLLSNIP